MILLKSLEYILILVIIFYWYSSGKTFNPLAIGLMSILILQIIIKKRILGFIIPGLLIIASLFMLMALMSEFSEFSTFNSEAKKMLFVGFSYFLSTIIVSGTMIYKYATLNSNRNYKSV